MLWEACLLWGVVYLDCVLIWSMMYPEAFLHPEVKLLDEGSWFTITHSHLVYFIPTLSASH